MTHIEPTYLLYHIQGKTAYLFKTTKEVINGHRMQGINIIMQQKVQRNPNLLKNKTAIEKVYNKLKEQVLIP